MLLYILQFIINLLITLFNQICFLSEKNIENTFKLHKNYNFYSILLGTLCSTLGKILYFLCPNIEYSYIFFLGHGLCFIGCQYYFMIFRSLQGFFAGWLLCYIFTISSVFCHNTYLLYTFSIMATLANSIAPIIIQYLSIRTIFIIFAIINFISAISMYNINIKSTNNNNNSINILEVIYSNIMYIILSALLLSLWLLLSNSILINNQNIFTHHLYVNSALMFISAIIGMSYSKKYNNIICILSIILFIIMNIYFQNAQYIGYIFICQIFYILNPLTIEYIIKQYNYSQNISSIMYITRSIITVLLLFFLKKYFTMYVQLILFSITSIISYVLLFVLNKYHAIIFYGKEK